jgi:hypothetical protein
VFDQNERAKLSVSSPGLTGRSSIPEPPEIKLKGHGVLDRPVKPGDDDCSSNPHYETWIASLRPQ